MRNKRAIIWAVIALLLALSISSCTRNIKETKIINKEAGIQILVASDSSEFKDNIRNRIIDKYKTQANIELINIENLEEIAPEEYKAVLIIDTLLAWTTFNFSTKNFINRQKSPDNIVLFITADNPDGRYRIKDIDAITSASKAELEDNKFLEISGKLDGIISGK